MLNLLGREQELFTEDIHNHKEELDKIVTNSRFLVIGDLANLIKDIYWFKGVLYFNTEKSICTMLKLIDETKLHK